MQQHILVCDDHSLFLSGITELLKQANPHYHVVGFTDSASCKSHAQQHRPDVFICDLNIDAVDGFTLIDELKEELRDAKVIILSAYYEDFLIEKAKKRGVHAFLKKETTAEELVAIIEEPKGAGFFTNKTHRKPQNAFSDKDGSVANRFRLSKQEKEIIRLIVAGKTTSEIADILFISKTTVATHRRNIHRKLEVSNTSSLIKFAHENQLLS
jgi:DNA-binding NarL/FixJ family response regulator